MPSEELALLPVKKPCDCDAKLADLTRAVEINNGAIEDQRRRYEHLGEAFNAMSDLLGDYGKKVDRLTESINFLGGQSQQHTDDMNAVVNQIREFGSSVGQMGPAGMMKMLMTGMGKKEKGSDNG